MFTDLLKCSRCCCIVYFKFLFTFFTFCLLLLGCGFYFQSSMLTMNQSFVINLTFYLSGSSIQISNFSPEMVSSQLYSHRLVPMLTSTREVQPYPEWYMLSQLVTRHLVMSWLYNINRWKLSLKIFFIHEDIYNNMLEKCQNTNKCGGIVQDKSLQLIY